MRYVAILLGLACPLPALACPAVADHTAALDGLFAEIQSAPSQARGLALGRELWRYWTDAPDETAQEMLDRGMRRREGFDYHGALSDFDALVTYCPEFAEGYNQRAFVNYLRQDFEAALPDLDHALTLQPRHTGALSGRALTYMALGRLAEAQDDLIAALELNPWLPERSLLLPPGALPSEKPGEEI